MEYKEGRLGYNRKNDRYGLLVTDLWAVLLSVWAFLSSLEQARCLSSIQRIMRTP